jgi:CheY-like chemotaxis protein
MLGIGEKREPATILLIDDDLVSREVIATVLTLHGHMVHTADDGPASLKMLESGTVAPEVILMDAQLPGLSGTALIEQLRDRIKAEIFLISGSQPPDELVAATDGFLLKPFGPADLKRLMGEHAPEPETPSPVTEDPAVDPETLAQFREFMTEPTVRAIYAAVVADLDKRLPALETALKEGNKDEVRRIGHAIKGGCGMAGARQASRLGARLEAESDHLDDCAATAQELYTATQLLKRMLDKEFPA